MLKVVPLDVKQRGPYQQAENAAGRTSRPKMLSGPTDVPSKLLTFFPPAAPFFLSVSFCVFVSVFCFFWVPFCYVLLVFFLSFFLVPVFACASLVAFVSGYSLLVWVFVAVTVLVSVSVSLSGPVSVPAAE